MKKLNHNKNILKILQSRLDKKYGRGILKAAKVLLLFGCISLFTSCASDNNSGNNPSPIEGQNQTRTNNSSKTAPATITIESTGQTANLDDELYDTDEPHVIDAYFAKKVNEDERKEGEQYTYINEDTYLPIHSANFSERVYVIVDTLNLRGKKIDVSILDQHGYLTKGKKMEKTTFKESKDGIYSATVGQEDFALLEIDLEPQLEENIKDWKKICKKNNTQFALKIKADAENVIYCGKNDEQDGDSNIWLNKDGSWFNIIYKIEVAPWVEIAYKEVGVYERDTKYGYDRVKEYYKDGAGQGYLDPIKVAWCSSFANWVLVETNKIKKTNFSFIPRNGAINNPALAINFVNKERYPGGIIIPPTEKPPYGSILIIQRLTNHEGHATFVINYTEESNGFTIVGLGGNQFDRVQLLSYKFTKKGSQYIYNNKFKHLGYVLPKEYEYDETDKDYYSYEDVIAPSATGSDLR